MINEVNILSGMYNSEVLSILEDYKEEIPFLILNIDRESFLITDIKKFYSFLEKNREKIKKVYFDKGIIIFYLDKKIVKYYLVKTKLKMKNLLKDIK